jgi:hypothetical protein
MHVLRQRKQWEEGMNAVRSRGFDQADRLKKYFRIAFKTMVFFTSRFWWKNYGESYSETSRKQVKN